jgi:MSHA biogenesis protein MshN
MSIINQVLKDLDRKGSETRAPSGVIAINQPETATPRWPIMLVGGVALTLAAAWWFWPAAPDTAPPPASVMPPPPPTAHELPLPTPQLRLSQQLSDIAWKSEAPAGTEAARPKALLASTMPPAQVAPQRNEPARAIISEPLKPRLDTRLPEITRPSVEAQPRVIKQDKPPTPQVQAEEVWRQASRLLEQGRNHDARARLENVLQLDPAHTAARQILIARELETGDGANAESLLRDGLALHPNDAWYPRSLAQVHLQRGDYAQAAGILKTALNKRADAANWALYASTVAKLGKPAESAQAYREALRLDPNQGNWWIGMAVALEKSNAKADAGAAYQRALQTRLSGELREFAEQKARSLAER